MKTIISVLTGIFCSISLLGQAGLNLSDYRKGDFVSIKYPNALLRATPNLTSEVLDTIRYNLYKPFVFKILNESGTNNFVNVEMIIANRSSQLIDSTKQIFSMSGGIAEGGLIGWVSKDEIEFNSIPDRIILSGYSNNLEILDCIIRHAEWQSFNNPEVYEEYYRPWHAECYFKISLYYYEKDSFQRTIFHMTKSIQILPKKTSYIIRAISKAQLEDYQGAISDCTKGINFENTQTYKTNESKYFYYYSMIYWKFSGIDLFFIRGSSY